MKKSKAIITLVVTLLVTAALGYVAICGIGSEKAGAASQIQQKTSNWDSTWQVVSALLIR